MTIISRLPALYRREPAATQAAVGVIWGGAIAIDRGVFLHTSVLNWQVVLAAGIALYGLLIRSQVIPVVKMQSALKGPPVVMHPGASSGNSGDGGPTSPAPTGTARGG